MTSTRKILRFEGPDGNGPCFGRQTGYFFGRFLARMETAWRVIPGFEPEVHFCAIEAEGFSKWCPPEALREAEDEGLILCIYEVERFLDEDPSKIYPRKSAPVWGNGPIREWQCAFAHEWVISVEKIPPASFSPDVHL